MHHAQGLAAHVEASGGAAALAAALPAQLSAAAAGADWDTAERALLALRALAAVPPLAARLRVRPRARASASLSQRAERRCHRSRRRRWPARRSCAYPLSCLAGPAAQARLAAQERPQGAQLDAVAAALRGEAGLDAEYRQELEALLAGVRAVLHLDDRAGEAARSEL